MTPRTKKEVKNLANKIRKEAIDLRIGAGFLRSEGNELFFEIENMAECIEKIASSIALKWGLS